jgi:hypothetical protein
VAADEGIDVLPKNIVGMLTIRRWPGIGEECK